MVGTLLGVETRKREIGTNHETIDVEIMNVLTDDGLRSVPLEQVGTIKLVNPQLDKEFRQALAVLALGHDADKKSVTLHFAGKGKRPVRVGYIQNMPIWKTSYRLVLSRRWQADAARLGDRRKHDRGRLARRAIDVGQRPARLVHHESVRSALRPAADGRARAVRRPAAAGLWAGHAMAGEADYSASSEGQRFGSQRIWPGSRIATTRQKRVMFSANEWSSFQTAECSRRVHRQSTNRSNQHTISSPGVNSVAQARRRRRAVSISIVPPVTLARQESAMLPIVDDEVGGKKLSVYNPAVQAKHPLCGLRLKNTTDLHLMQGPITVFDGGTYAGDARIEDIAPGGERLLTYALDLDVECTSQTSRPPEEIASIRLRKGVLYVRAQAGPHAQVQSQKLEPKGQDRPGRAAAGNRLASGRAQGADRNSRRCSIGLRVEVEPGKSAELEVVEEQMVGSADRCCQYRRRARSISSKASGSSAPRSRRPWSRSSK